MRILDRYILKPIIITFLGCLFIFIFIYIISDILGRLDEILKNRIALIFILQYYLTYLPIIFTQVSPIAILLSTIYTFGKLNRNNELIAMRSSGLSLWQIAAPVLIIGLILSIFVFFVNERLIPQSQIRCDEMKNKLEGNKNENSKNEKIGNLTFFGLRNRLFFISSFDTQNNVMEGITILEHDEKQNLIAKITAKRAVYKDNLWIFYEFNRFNFDEFGQVKSDSAYNEEQMVDVTETPHDFLQQRKRPELMDTSQLQDYIWRLRKSGATPVVRNVLVDLYQRYAASFSSLILILIGIPFSFMIRRRANIFSSFGICMAISFLYYVFNAVSLALGKTGIIFPFLSAWLMPGIFSFLSINAIQKSS